MTYFTKADKEKLRKTARSDVEGTANFTVSLETKLNGIETNATKGATWGLNITGQPAIVGQAEAEAGTATIERIWTALRVSQAIAALESGGGAGGGLALNHWWGGH